MPLAIFVIAEHHRKPEHVARRSAADSCVHQKPDVVLASLLRRIACAAHALPVSSVAQSALRTNHAQRFLLHTEPSRCALSTRSYSRSPEHARFRHPSDVARFDGNPGGNPAAVDASLLYRHHEDKYGDLLGCMREAHAKIRNLAAQNGM